MSAEKYTKNVLMKGFIFPAIYQMHVVLNFLNNHEKQKNQQNHSFISEAKQKVKKKKQWIWELKGQERKNVRGSSKGSEMNGGEKYTI